MRRIHLSALGLVFAVAFWSLHTQVLGLFGAEGIAPIADTMERLRGRFGAGLPLDGLARVPTVFWWRADDTMLRLVTGAGMAAGLLAGVTGWRVALAVCWALYLSVGVVGEPFLSFQWDTLLLEAGLIAVFWREGGRIGRWLTLWLLVRLIFWAGVVKLASGDATWRDLSALDYHFWTQPIPTWTAWWAHQLPSWLKAAGCGVMFLVELLAPVLLFQPRTRRFAAAAIVLLMAGIAATGSFGFFNLLTVVLCIAAFDRAPHGPWWRELPAVPLLVVALFMNVVHLDQRFGTLSEAEIAVAKRITPFRSFNSYGLFANMTESRREIRLEGYVDGRWEPYVFPYKPDDLERRPRFAGLHMPRLDWQMWFAALGSVQRNPWLVRTMERLHEGSPHVLALFEHAPSDPVKVRAVVRDYTFTELGEPGWWRASEPLGLYAPTVD